MKNTSKTIITILLTFIITVLLLIVILGLFLSKYDLPFEKLIKIGAIIESSYVGEYNMDECEENAINAVLESLDDKYAVYYNEKNASEFMQMIDGYYVGIGTEIVANTEKDRIEIVSAYEDSPAEKAGIRGGDLIISIDGKEYTASSIADAVSYMKGIGKKKPFEKSMNIKILRGTEELNFNLKREKINMYKVSSETVDGICYIRYSGFTEESLKELKKIVSSLDKDIQGIVIDVRNNPGGEFGSAIGLCDLFLDEGMIIYTENKAGEKTVYNADKKACKLPLAIIVNGYSASASEIFAGSMKANGRAVIVGEKTYGKGVSQTVSYLNPADKSEGALKLTTCKNYTPDGRWINESILPDIEATTEKISENITEDVAFKVAAAYLKKDKQENEE